MGKKICLSSLFLFKIKNPPKTLSSFSSSFSSSSSSSSCCILPKTHSFRVSSDEIYKTVNSIYFDSQDSFNNEEKKIFSPNENVIRRVGSDRIFFDPGESSASIMMVKSKGSSGVLFKESIAMTVDSEDPGRDFRVSMEEIVAANGVKEWGKLVELFVWFLRANGKENHGFIFGAFLELIVGLAASSSSSSSSSTCSSSSSSFVSGSLEIEELQEESEF